MLKGVEINISKSLDSYFNLEFTNKQKNLSNNPTDVPFKAEYVDGSE